MWLHSFGAIAPHVTTKIEPLGHIESQSFRAQTEAEATHHTRNNNTNTWMPTETPTTIADKANDKGYSARRPRHAR